MKNLKKATSIAETIVIMFIITTWLIWMYKIFWESKKLLVVTKNRIEAIQIAREWIEAMINIRNTNWLLYSADSKNCWNTLNYANNCIGNTRYSTQSNSTDIAIWSYIIYKMVNNRWVIMSRNSGSYNSSVYRDDFEVSRDSDLFYTQTWWISFKPLFTREIKVNYLDTDANDLVNSNDEKMRVVSIVRWKDNSSSKPYKVELETILSNWKDKF